VYAEVFPEIGGFWTEMALDEVQHANWIDKCCAKVENNQEFFVVERFRIQPLEFSIKSVKEQAVAAREPGFSLLNALSIALQLEKALLENKYFEVFDGDSEGVKNTLNQLVESTKVHYQKVYEHWKAYGGRELKKSF